MKWNGLEMEVGEVELNGVVKWETENLNCVVMVND